MGAPQGKWNRTKNNIERKDMTQKIGYLIIDYHGNICFIHANKM